MINRIRLLYKSLTGEISTLKSIGILMRTSIGYISSIFSIAVLMNDLAGIDIFETWIKLNWIKFVIYCLFFSCIINRQKLKYCKKVSNCDMQVEISIKDIFSNWSANSFIIPTNTFFRTKMDDEYVSPRSVQGRFQLKYFNKKTEYLNKLISENLRKQGIVGKKSKDCFGETMQYPIGTVVKINYKRKHFYFVAINDVNEYGKPTGQTIENVSVCLNSIINTIQKIGHCDTLCIPLIGSGKAAIQEATKERVFQKTVDCFIQSKDKIVNKLIISISPKDYINGNIDLKRIKSYLDYKCEFK